MVDGKWCFTRGLPQTKDDIIPQATTVPSTRTATLRQYPAATAVAFVSVGGISSCP